MEKMRNWIAAGFIVGFVLILIFYSGHQIPAENDSVSHQTINQDIDHIDSDPPQKEDAEEKYNPALELLYTGNMDGLEFGIGSDSGKIIEQRGEPDQEDNFMGGLLLSYDELFFLTDGFMINGRITHGKVTGIYYIGEESVYGVHIGMPLDQVEELLGDPYGTSISHYSELYTDNNIIVQYRAGGYAAIFEIDDESDLVCSISIWQEEK